MFLLHDIPNGHDLIIAKYRIIINLEKKFWWQLLFWLTSRKLYWFFLANKYCFFSIISYFLIKLQHELMCYCHTRLLSRLTMKNIHFCFDEQYYHQIIRHNDDCFYILQWNKETCDCEKRVSRNWMYIVNKNLFFEWKTTRRILEIEFQEYGFLFIAHH